MCSTDSPTERQNTECQWTEHRCTERQKYPSSNMTQHLKLLNVNRLNIETIQRQIVLYIEQLNVDFEC